MIANTGYAYYTADMSDLNIRNVPDELLSALKADAALARKTLRQFVIDRLLGREEAVAPKKIMAAALETLHQPTESTIGIGEGWPHG